MRRSSFLGQVLMAVARSTPAASPARENVAESRMAGPAAQVLTAVARNTPAFAPDGVPALGAGSRASPQNRSAETSPVHAGADPGIVQDLVDFGRRTTS